MKTIRNTFFMLGYVAKYTPAFFFWTIIEGLVWGCIHSFTSVLFVKELFDKIERGVQFSEILVLVGWMALFFVLAYIFHEWYWQFIEPKAKQELHKRMQGELFEKAGSLDLSCYDSPEFYTDFVWAINEADSRAVSVCESMGKFINRFFSSSVIIGVLFSIDLLIVIVVCLSVLITVWLKLVRTRLQFERDGKTKPIQRKADYIGRVHYLADYAKELRSSDAEGILVRDFDKAVDGVIKETKSYSVKMFFVNLVRSTTVSLMFDIGITLLLTYKIMVEKTVSLGDFAVTVGAMWKLLWQLNTLLDYFAKFKENSLYTEKFRVFLNYKPTVCDGENAKVCGKTVHTLELKNISFAYPGTDKNIINDLSMTIKAGQKIALVGYNGAGKSTLVKLILRLYDPNSGKVLINGEDIKDFTISSYRSKFSTIFQDFRIYSASVAENVLCGKYTNVDEKRVNSALSNSGFDEKLASMPHGIDTVLTKEFDSEGINLSGGEAQKIAIARVFARDCDIVILDEPSSALDPDSEYELNKTLMTAFDKTVIIISHRLSTTRMADMIYMLEDGKIIEQGDHDSLMKLDGKYAEMFNKQAEKYNLDKEQYNG